ncbi:MAG: ATP-binding cassette domain-containing protein [Thermoflexaceae bacterium]|nr:ATP-binding cassette domain-containing protein [Thermoflexaceae bacterium]
MALIEVENLSKQFRVARKPEGGRGRLRRLRRDFADVHAVDGVSFAVEAGEMVGYIGPNGAGKSTTIKMLTGILVPSGGRLSVAGFEPSRQRRELARQIGVVFGQRTQLWWDLPLADSFDLLKHIYHVPMARFAANLERCVELMEMGEFLRTPVRQLSLGQRMRGELTAALLHDPAILYLDEPTIGLDVVAKARIRAFLTALNRDAGTTVLLTTHDMGDIERLCRRVIIIDRGGILYDGALDPLKARFAIERTLVVDLEEPAPPLEVPFAIVERVEGPRQWLRFQREQTSAADLIAAVARAAHIADLRVDEPSIEDVVLRIYAGGAGERFSSTPSPG